MPTSTFTVRAEDDLGNFADREFSIEVLNTIRESLIFVSGRGDASSRLVQILTDDDFTNSEVETVVGLDLPGASRTEYAGGAFFVVSQVAANGIDGVFYRSTDGRIFTDLTASLPAAAAGFLARKVGSAIWAPGPDGLYRSVDGGENWSREGDAPLPLTPGTWSSLINATTVGAPRLQIAENAQSGTLILAQRTSAGAGPFRLFRSTDGGASWASVFDATTSDTITTLEGVGGAFIVNFGSLQSVSFDDGLTWLDVTPVNLGAYFNWVYLNGRWVASRPLATNSTGRNFVWTTDFQTLTTPPNPLSSPFGFNTRFRASEVVALRGKLFAYLEVGNGPTSVLASNKRIITSEDGETWTVSASAGFEGGAFGPAPGYDFLAAIDD